MKIDLAKSLGRWRCFRLCSNSRLSERRYKTRTQNSFIASISVGLLLDTSCHITDLELDQNRIGNEQEVSS
jgi:hypothetical protein